MGKLKFCRSQLRISDMVRFRLITHRLFYEKVLKWGRPKANYESVVGGEWTEGRLS